MGEIETPITTDILPSSLAPRKKPLSAKLRIMLLLSPTERQTYPPSGPLIKGNLPVIKVTIELLIYSGMILMLCMYTCACVGLCIPAWKQMGKVT